MNFDEDTGDYLGCRNNELFTEDECGLPSDIVQDNFEREMEPLWDMYSDVEEYMYDCRGETCDVDWLNVIDA